MRQRISFFVVCVYFCLFVSIYTLFGHKMDTKLQTIFFGASSEYKPQVICRIDRNIEMPIFIVFRCFKISSGFLKLTVWNKQISVQKSTSSNHFSVLTPVAKMSKGSDSKWKGIKDGSPNSCFTFGSTRVGFLCVFMGSGALFKLR